MSNEIEKLIKEGTIISEDSKRLEKPTLILAGIAVVWYIARKIFGK